MMTDGCFRVIGSARLKIAQSDHGVFESSIRVKSNRGGST
jgi:hypothetical protein